jgi:hypothetical protein
VRRGDLLILVLVLVLLCLALLTAAGILGRSRHGYGSLPRSALRDAVAGAEVPVSPRTGPAA